MPCSAAIPSTWPCRKNASGGSGQGPPDRRAGKLWGTGRFARVRPSAASGAEAAWDHLAYSYAIENTRVVQILDRVVSAYRTGESLGVPSPGTQRWLDVSQMLLGRGEPVPYEAAGAPRRVDQEASRRNAYWRLLGLDLAFGTPNNRPPDFVKASAANPGFVGAWEALLTALRPVRSAPARLAAVRQAAWPLREMLAARRQGRMLDRIELQAATLLGWAHLSLQSNHALILDLQAQAPTPAERLALVGQRVGLPAHSRSAALFALAGDFSSLLRWVESLPATQEAMLRYRGRLPDAALVVRASGAWRSASGRSF